MKNVVALLAVASFSVWAESPKQKSFTSYLTDGEYFKANTKEKICGKSKYVNLLDGVGSYLTMTYGNFNPKSTSSGFMGLETYFGRFNKGKIENHMQTAIINHKSISPYAQYAKIAGVSSSLSVSESFPYLEDLEIVMQTDGVFFEQGLMSIDEYELCVVLDEITDVKTGKTAIFENGDPAIGNFDNIIFKNELIKLVNSKLAEAELPLFDELLADQTDVEADVVETEDVKEDVVEAEDVKEDVVEAEDVKEDVVEADESGE